MATFVSTFSGESACEAALLEARFPGGHRELANGLRAAAGLPPREG